MSNSDKIRDAMRAAPDSTQAQITERSGVGGKLVSTFLAQGVGTTGEVLRKGESGAYTFSLNPAYTPKRKRREQAEAAPERAQRVKKLPRKAARKKKSYKSLVKKVAELPRVMSLRDLAMHSYCGIGANLREHLRDNVENIEGDRMLCMLIEQHERAERIVAAAAGVLTE